MKVNIVTNHHEVSFWPFLLSLLSLTTISASILLSTYVSANGDSAVGQIGITVPIACTMSGTGMNSHNAEINNGQYSSAIGETIIKAVCNDNEGFAIYAAGYTGNEIGGENSNKLVGTTASSNATIESGIATAAGNPDISNWAMKLQITQDSGDTTGTNAFTIDSAPNVDLPSQAEQSATPVSFSEYHVVPNEYVKVAHKNSGTDMAETTGGVKLTTTYAAYISKTQPADTYSGQVIYTLVHPSNHEAPIANPAMLDTGKTVNSKLKSLAATVVNGEETTITPEFDPSGNYDRDYGYDGYIKSISVHLKTPAPADFNPSEMNTISTTASKKPIYIVFDNTNDAGIMHFYTEGEKIFLPSDSSFMFYLFANLSEISGISDWDTSNATNMSYMFSNADYSATTWSIGDLSSWNTSNVTNMSYMFYFAGSSATTFTLNLSSWNTSNVTNMSYMFSGAGSSATTWSIGDLSSWNTSNVTDMSGMLSCASYSATTWSIGDLSSWNTSNVTNMSRMFYYAGSSVTTFTLDLSSWNTSNVTNMSYMFASVGSSATTFTLNLSSWNTSNVTNMSYMFDYAGRFATTFTLDLSSWNTSNVTNMSSMFSNAGRSDATWSVTIPQTNGNSINNTTSRLYGQTTSKYAAPRSGKSFTIAQP